VMRALVIPLVILLAGCASTTSSDGGQRLRAFDRDGVARAKLKPAAESDSPLPGIVRVQELLALLGYDPGPADGITGSATKVAMKKASADLRMSISDESDTTSFARALETELTKRVRVAQEQLATRGYDPGNADGHLGPRTRVALARFRADNGLPDSPAIPLDWTSQPVKPALMVKVEVQSAKEPAPNDVPPMTPPDGDQELLTAGQRVVVLLPEQKEGRILTVRDDGTIEVPNMGPVQAAGKRPSDVEKAIAVEYLDRYVATLVGAVRVSNAPP
jgi:peptidoglycan hydrolase-like protein with peptidoglycan-binding domain